MKNREGNEICRKDKESSEKGQGNIKKDLGRNEVIGR